MTQQARNVLMNLDDEGVERPRFLIRDRDRKFSRDFDEVFRPKASSKLPSERRRRARTPSAEHRSHRSLNQRPPLNPVPPLEEQGAGGFIAFDRLRRRDRLGGLIHEYQLAA